MARGSRAAKWRRASPWPGTPWARRHPTRWCSHASRVGRELVMAWRALPRCGARAGRTTRHRREPTLGRAGQCLARGRGSGRRDGGRPGATGRVALRIAQSIRMALARPRVARGALRNRPGGPSDPHHDRLIGDPRSRRPRSRSQASSASSTAASSSISAALSRTSTTRSPGQSGWILSASFSLVIQASGVTSRSRRSRGR